MSVTVFRQSAILDQFKFEDLKQVCFALDYKEPVDGHCWDELRALVGNLLLDKRAQVFKDQAGIINIIDR